MEVMTAGLKTGAVTGRILEAAVGRGSGPGSAGKVEEVGLCARGLAASFPLSPNRLMVGPEPRITGIGGLMRRGRTNHGWSLPIGRILRRTGDW